MNRPSKIILGFMSLSLTLSAQWSGHNVLAYQRGNVPFETPEDQSTGYNQLNLKYRQQKMQASIRIENYQHPDQDLSYGEISQYQLGYTSRQMALKLGHIYEMIGRGLLLRTYEIPGNVYEDGGYRVRHGLYRDLEGVSITYRSKHLSLKGLRGRPLINILPPTIETTERRLDLVEAVESHFRLGSSSVGAALLRNSREDDVTDYATWMAESTLPMNVSIYLELAHELDKSPFDDDSPFAFYSSLNWAASQIGLSIEYKEYNRFSLGSGFNDPPPLVKEHNYPVLNRSTHVLSLQHEKGFQAEGFYRFQNGQRLTLNRTQARNALAIPFEFSETFAEWVVPLSGRQFKAFVDQAEDGLRGESDRWSAGFVWEEQVSGPWSATLDVQGQQFENNFDPGKKVWNTLIRLNIAKSPKLSVTLIGEASSDPKFTDKPSTFEVEEEMRYWFGAGVGFKPNHHHTIQMFYGKRRGGPACTSGICYEVLDFEGLEFRLTSRF